MDERILAPELLWDGASFVAGKHLRIDGEGRIAGIADRKDKGADGASSAAVERLPRQALLPGFVNAHSHAFQRGLRGRGERFPSGEGSFWSWREAMYGLVAELDRERLHALCRQAFEEMLDAGITTVGEFHYLRHDDAQARDHAFDQVVLDAAAAAGIRIVLLLAYYATGGIGEPLRGAQRRFATPDLDGYWRQHERLAQRLRGPEQGLGAVAHSIRAVPRRELASLAGEARARGLVLHMHLEEQRREIDDSVAAYDRRPLELVLETIEVDRRFTAVHGTHSRAEDLRRLGAAGANLCLCPTTEANLGDGIAGDLPAFRQTGGRLCLGSDSNARIAMTEEARWLEYAQRLAGERRGVLVDGDGRLGPVLLDAATAGGARALGLAAGTLEAGSWADLLTVDLDAPSLAGSDPDHLLDAFLLGGRDDTVAGVMVGGRWRRRPSRER